MYLLLQLWNTAASMSSCRSTSTAVEYAFELNSRLEIEKNSWTPLTMGALALTKGTVRLSTSRKNRLNDGLSSSLLLKRVFGFWGFRVQAIQGPEMIWYGAVHL